MTIVQQYQCPDCYELYDEKFDAQTCCERQVQAVFAFSDGRYFDSDGEAKESVYLDRLRKGESPLDARQFADSIEVIFAD